MKRILLIDDEEGIRSLWKRFHEVTEPVFRGLLEMDVAEDLEQGIERIGTGAYDAVILDLKFKGIGVDSTVNYIAEHAKDDGIPPIIVLTGDDDIHMRSRCMTSGAASFWLKADAISRPDLFFKEVYNQFLRHYATHAAA